MCVLADIPGLNTTRPDERKVPVHAGQSTVKTGDSSDTMSKIDDLRKFTRTHEWVCVDDEGYVRVGISDYAQDSLGDIVYVELPEVGGSLKAGDEAGVIESVKAAAELYSPLAGTVVDTNKALAEAPELVNDDCYGDGWLIKIKPNDNKELEDLLTASDYQKLCDSESS